MLKHKEFRRTLLLMSDRSEVTLSLRYFFTVVFGYRVDVLSDFAELNSECHMNASPKLVAVALLGLDEKVAAIESAIQSFVPRPFVLVFTEESSHDAGLAMFEAGADEVVRFPIPLKELAYRLRARSDRIGLSFVFDDVQEKRLEIATDIARHAELTKLETQVMHILMMRHGEIVTRNDLSLAIDNTSWQYGDRRFDVHVGKIRKKLLSAFRGELTVRTVHSAGYRLALVSDEANEPNSGIAP